LSDFFISPFVHPNSTIEKLKSHGLPIPFNLFSYIKREKEERKKKREQK
jgi:hypothetical protein